MIEKYTRWILRFRWLVIALSLGLVAAAGTGLPKLTLSADLEVFFAPDDPDLAAYDLIRNTYSRDDNLFLVFVPPGGEIFTQENLAILEEITEAAWKVPHTNRVDSIVNYQHTEAVGDDLAVRPLVEDARHMTDEQVAHARQVATTEPLLLKRLITSHGDMAAINLSINFPADRRRQSIPESVAAVRAMRKDFESRYPGAELLITGKVAGNNAFTEASFYDIEHIIPMALGVALACIALFLGLASRSVVTAAATTGATIVIIIAAVIVGMGMAGWVGILVTPPLVNAPTIILTLAVADCVHLLMTYFQGRRKGQSRHDAVLHSMRMNFQAVLLTSLTTVIGFLALNSSDAPPFRDLGNVAAMGIVAAWALSITLFPVLMSFLPGSVAEEDANRKNAMERLAVWVLAHRRGCMVTTTALILAAMAFLPRNELYDVWAEYFDKNTQIRLDSDRARKELNGFNTLEFSLGAGKPGGIMDPAYLKTLDAFSEWLKQQPEVNYTNHIGEIMKRLNRNMHGDDPAWHRLPDDPELSAQYLLLYEFSLPFGLDLTNQINLDKSASRLTAGLTSSSTKNVLAIQARAGEWLRQNAPPEFFHPGASSDSMFAHVGQRNVVSMLTGSAIGILTISVVIGIALRSLRFGLLSLLFNALPVLVGFGLWGLTVGRIGMGLSVVSGLTMGIVVDYTIHLLSKYQIARQEQGLNTEAAIRYSFATVGAALVVTTVVLCVNFGLLYFSVFVLNSEMGVLTATIILIALAIDLFLLPPLLLFLDRDESATAPGTPAARGFGAARVTGGQNLP